MKTFFRRSMVVLVLLLCFSVVLEARDWNKFPARVDIPCAPLVAVVGDVHGAFDEFSASLETLGMAKRNSPDSFDITWTGGTALLVFTGDLPDRGKYTKEVYDAVMSLEIQAPKAGGRVVALFGNHDALLLNGTVEKWAKTLKPPKQQHYQNTLDSFTRAGLDFHQAISTKGTYGAWIRTRPLFAVVNGFLFIHGGLPAPAASLSDIAANYRDDIEANDFSKGIFMNETGPLWHREWWDNNELVDQNLQLMGVRGVIFGHTIGSLATAGSIGAKDNRLVGIDVGMCPAYGNSKGGGLLMRIQDGRMTFTAMYPDRPATELFQVPAPAPASIQPGRTIRRQPANEVLPRTGTMD
jgi:hypothetical protein